MFYLEVLFNVRASIKRDAWQFAFFELGSPGFGILFFRSFGFFSGHHSHHCHFTFMYLQASLFKFCLVVFFIDAVLVVAWPAGISYSVIPRVTCFVFTFSTFPRPEIASRHCTCQLTRLLDLVVGLDPATPMP